jgi:hypothetical protein
MHMPISAHQLNNVLRVYGDQLCQSRISEQPEFTDISGTERISISAKIRQKIIIDGITKESAEKNMK